MANKLSPETWITNFIKSASNGRTINPRLRRLLTIIAVSIWCIGLFQIIISYKGAIEAIPKYQSIQQFKKSPNNHDYDDNNYYGGHVHQSWDNDGESTHMCSFNSEFWTDLGVVSPSHVDSLKGLLAIAEQNQIDRLYGFFSLPIYIFLLVLLPWLIIRLIFWIIDADKAY